MSGFEDGRDEAMERLVRALETAPPVAVPEDFVTRVMARVPQRPRRRYVLRQAMETRSHVGRSLAFAALLLLVAGMLLLAPQTPGSPVWLWMQALLFVQLIALLLWMGISYKRLL